MSAHGWGAEALLPVPFVLLGLAYAGASWAGTRRGRPWPASRSVSWWSGIVACLIAVASPLAELAHHVFAAHMVTHLLLGMAGPLLLVRGAPGTLALRGLPVGAARRLVRVLSSRLVRLLGHPVVAAVGSLAGLWLLYTTGLYRASTEHGWVHLLVQAHVFLFGYLFAAAVVGVDPDPHRSSLALRAAVLVVVAAGHAILAKRLYASPPPGVGALSAQLGAQVMYYGGDAVEIALMVLLGCHWYAAAGRPLRRAGAMVNE